MLTRHIAVVVTLLVLFAAPAVAHQDPAERPVSLFRGGLPSGIFGGAVAAAGPDTFLAVWNSQWRGGQAARLSATGERLDAAPTGLPLVPAYAFWGDDHWVVVGTEGWVRLSEGGELLDAQPRPLGVPIASIQSAAWDGRSLFLAVYDPRPPRPVLTLLTFDRDMALKNTHTIVLDRPATNTARVASDGRTAVMFHDAGGGTTMATLFDADGVFIRQRILFTGSSSVVSVGSRGTGGGYFIVSWVTAGSAMAAGYHGFVVDHALTAQRTADAGLALSADFAPTIPWDGSALHLFMTGFNGRITAMRLTIDGAVIDRAEFTTRTGRESLHLYAASLPGATLLLDSIRVFALLSSTSYLQARAGATPAGIAAAPVVPVDVGASDQQEPAAASTAAQSLVAWREQVSGERAYGLFATRLSSDGAVLDPQSLRIAERMCPSSRPAVAAVGSDFLVAWYEAGGIRTARVAADGAVGPATLVHRDVRCHDRSPLIVPSNSAALVVWLVPTSVTTSRVFAARVRPDGTPIDVLPMLLGVAEGPVHGASNGSDFLVTWFNYYTRITAGGTVLDNSADRFLGFSTVVAGAWWNGTTYSVLHGDATTLRITRVGTTGTATPTGVAMPRPAGLSMVDPACNAAGCSLGAVTIEDGKVLLRELRASDNGAVASIALSEPVRLAAAATQVAPFQVIGERLFAAFVRREVSPPAGGAWRVFIRAMHGSPRSRSARH